MTREELDRLEELQEEAATNPSEYGRTFAEWEFEKALSIHAHQLIRAARVVEAIERHNARAVQSEESENWLPYFDNITLAYQFAQSRSCTGYPTFSEAVLAAAAWLESQEEARLMQAAPGLEDVVKDAAGWLEDKP